MKKNIILSTVLFAVGLFPAQTITPSISENYILTKSYIAKDGDTISKPPITNIQYFDGLGRLKQTVDVKVTPQGKDLVNHIEYDAAGRQVKDYLPIPQTVSQNGAIYSNPLNSSFYGSEKIYGEKIFENSPMDRIKQQVNVGSSWASKPVNYQYETNVSNEVKNIRIQTLQLADGTENSYLAKGTSYLAGTLLKNIVIDEDGNKTITFTDRTGNTVLVRKVLTTSENQDTYYLYNNQKQLAYVISPLASKKINELPGPSITQVPDDIITQLCYQYKYDGRNRLVEKKLPGKGWEYMLYDKQDRLVGTQDTVLKAKGQWLYTKYDQFGRVAITGIGTGEERSVEQVTVDSFGSNNVIRINTPFFNRQGMDVYYNNPDGSYPDSSHWVTLLSIKYYDSYPGYSFNPAFPSSILNEPTLTETPTAEGLSTKSLPVMYLVKNIEDDNWTKNYTYYDKKGRAIGSYSINHLGGRTQTESKLDFAGVVQQNITRHKRLNTDTDKVITENFTYDTQNRLLTHTHKVDNNPAEYLAQNSYNELSQLSAKKVGGTSPSVPLQDVSYTYNIRGWMTQINDVANLNGKLFGYKIKYNDPENAVAKFNGNIAEVDWITGTVANGSKRRYSYQYDNLNRLLQGTYSEPGSSVLSNDYYNEILSYDLNGNISTLKRFSRPGSGTTAEKIDDLVYNYTGNRLDMITLPSGVANNPSGYNALQNSITYDSNGNMTSNLDKRISEIGYNFMNLPSLITVGSGKSASQTNYLYRADGMKVEKTIFQNNVANTTLYLDGFQYQFSQGSVAGSELKFVPTSGGYFNFENNRYIYNYTDHLGNVRVSYFHNGTGIEVLEENNYYPFGLKHVGYNVLAGNPSYQYKYNGKELQTETGMYDYGWRQYMPDLGRWIQSDPLIKDLDFTFDPHNIDDDDDDEVASAIETTLGNGGGIFNPDNLSPYSYGYNNPIKFDDPDGRCPTCIVGAIVGAATDYGLQVAANYLDPTIKNKWTDNISLSSIALSAVEGGLTQGASAVRKAAVKTTVMVVKNTVEVNTTKGAKIETNVRNIAKNTLVDAAAGGIAKKAGGLAKTAKLNRVAQKVKLSNTKSQNLVKKVTGLSSRTSNSVAKKLDIKGISKQLSNGVKNSTNKAVENTVNATSKNNVDKLKDKTNE